MESLAPQFGSVLIPANLTSDKESDIRAKPVAVDAKGWPVGFFEETAGCFANEPFDYPADLALEPIANW